MPTTLSFIKHVATCQSFPASPSSSSYSKLCAWRNICKASFSHSSSALGRTSFSLENKVERRRSSAHTNDRCIYYRLHLDLKKIIPKRAWKSLDLKMWMTRSIAMRSCLSWADVNRAWYSSSNSRARWASADDTRKNNHIFITCSNEYVVRLPCPSSRTPMASC